MRNLRHTILATVVLATGLFLIMGCSHEGGNPVGTSELQMARLMGSWNAKSTQLDNIDKEGFQNFVLTLSPLPDQPRLSYIISENPYASPWRTVTTGSLSLDQDQPDKYLVREDGAVIEYVVTDNTLSMRFTFADSKTGGKISGVGGEWIFLFEKNN
ncbi:MAG TPA: hypothetical protein VD816_12125 [Ohtaekwangia sp.]|nr:hypothetical protein [Ohtaekwangia sp.]